MRTLRYCSCPWKDEQETSRLGSMMAFRGRLFSYLDFYVRCMGAFICRPGISTSRLRLNTISGKVIMYNVTPTPSDSVLNTFIVAGITAISGCVVTPAFLLLMGIPVRGVESPTICQRLEYYSKPYHSSWDDAFGSLSGLFFSIVGFGLVISPLFLVARVLIVIVAFTSVRSVPAGVYASIPWTQYIPHI